MTQSLILAAGALVGSLAKAWVSTEQNNFGRQSAIDVGIGVAVGILYPLFPVVPLPETANWLQQGTLMAVISYFSSDLVGNVLLKLGVKKPEAGK